MNEDYKQFNPNENGTCQDGIQFSDEMISIAMYRPVPVKRYPLRR